MITIKIAIMITIMIANMNKILSSGDPFALKGCSASGKHGPVQILQFR